MKVIKRVTYKVDRRLSKNVLFKLLGYKMIKYGKGWKREVNGGHFHVTHEGDELYNLHFDVDTVNGRHMTLPSTHTLQNEDARIRPILVKWIRENLKIKDYIRIINYLEKEKIKKENKEKKVKIKIKSETLNYNEMKIKLKELKKKSFIDSVINKLKLWQKQK